MKRAPIKPIAAPAAGPDPAPGVPRGNGQSASLSGSGAVLTQNLPQHLTATLKNRWKCYRKQLKRCQKKFSEKAVHQFRVESRRLLSLLELTAAFLPAERVEKIRRCLKRHLDTFGDLRDTHVQLQLMKKLCRDYPEAKAFESYLRKREKRVDRRTRKDVQRVKTKPLARLIAACRDDLENRLDLLAFEVSPRLPAGPSARPPRRGASAALSNPGQVLLDAADQAFRRTLELKGLIDPERTKTIHCTRVAFKKFRYMVETLSAFLPVARPGQLAAMHRYHTLLGDIQDLVVLIQAFDKFDAKKGSKIKQRPGKDFHETLLRRRHQLIARYLSRSNQLSSFWPRPNPHRS